MAYECFDCSKIVTRFLLDTCVYPPRPSIPRVQAAEFVGIIAERLSAVHDEGKLIPLTTGSVAEFYIQPMLSDIGDIDVMFYWNAQLAIPRGHPLPTQLPAEFHKCVNVHEIIDSHLPGYVYLELNYLLIQRVEDDTYEYFEYDEKVLLRNSTPWANIKTHMSPTAIHGPAVRHDNSYLSLLSLDEVCCIRCLLWPPQAADWPARHRNYDWPDSVTIDRVVSNGCDVVGVAHRHCRQDEWMGKCQCRLSFSRAEIVLINSWTPELQIVYHVLRYFMKTALLTESVDNSGAGTLSNYHIKTLMLWACELKPINWWTKNVNFVRLCVELLNTSAVWSIDTRYPHYFVSNCNLVDISLNVISVASKLMSLDKEYLSTWLVNNYIGQCARLGLFYISRLVNDPIAGEESQTLVSLLDIVRLNSLGLLHNIWQADQYVVLGIPAHASSYSFTVHYCACFMNELTKIDKRFSVYFAAVTLLYVARRISRNGFDDKLLDIVATVLGINTDQCQNIFCWCRPRTEVNPLELVELLQKSAIEHLTTYRQFLARYFDSAATIIEITIVTTDFEALYPYKRGDYQRCLQLSKPNVHTLLYADVMLSVPIYSVFIQLLDDDIVSLTAMTLIVGPKCRGASNNYYVSQLTLSLYLMTQCQLKLHHSVTSLAQTLDHIKVARRRLRREKTLDQLTLMLIARKVYTGQ